MNGNQSRSTQNPSNEVSSLYWLYIAQKALGLPFLHLTPTFSPSKEYGQGFQMQEVVVVRAYFQLAREKKTTESCRCLTLYYLPKQKKKQVLHIIGSDELKSNAGTNLAFVSYILSLFITLKNYGSFDFRRVTYVNLFSARTQQE